MNTVELVLAALGFVFALGSGVSLGWVLCEKHRKSSPEGVAKVAASAAEQISLVRHDAEREIGRSKALFDETKAFFVDQLASWQAHAASLSKVLLSPPPPPVPTSPPEPPRRLDPDQSVARLTGDGLNESTKHRDELMNKLGLTANEADAIVDGRVDELPTEELLSRIQDGIIQERTGVT